MKIGVLGGSFDPVHLGHLALCKAAFELLPIERLLLIPAYNHPFKGANSFFSFEERCHFLQLATKNLLPPEKLIEVLELEKENPNENYTFQTLEILHQKYKSSVFYFLVGIDNLPAIHLWKNLERIHQLSVITPFLRQGFQVEEIWKQIKPLLPQTIFDALKNNCLTVNLPEISSTQIREHLQQGQSVQHLIPDILHPLVIKK